MIDRFLNWILPCCALVLVAATTPAYVEAGAVQVRASDTSGAELRVRVDLRIRKFGSIPVPVRGTF